MIAPAVQNAANLWLRSVVPSDQSVKCKLVTYWHRQVYAAAGAASFNFFNVAKSKYVTNLPVANQIPGGHVFLARALRVSLCPNITFATGAIAVAAATLIASVDPLTMAEQQRLILQNGQWEFRVNNKPEADGYGLMKLGAGSQPVISANGSNATGSSITAMSNVTNGSPDANNGWKFNPCLVIPENTTFEFSIEFQTAIALAQVGVIQADLEGILIGPAN